MSKLVRVALYTLSTKQGRNAIIGIIAVLICGIMLPIIIIGGFASSYISVFGGEADDVYAQAINEIKTDYKIENSFEPALLRAIYFNKYETTETNKNNVKNTIEKYFIRSEVLPRTITEEDIEAIQEQIEETENQLNDALNQIPEMKYQINELDNKINDAKENCNDTKEIIDLLNENYPDEALLKFFYDRYQKQTEQLNSLQSEKNRKISQYNNLKSKSKELSDKYDNLSIELKEAQETYAKEPITVYYFLELEEIKIVLSSAPFSYDRNLLEEVETLILVMRNYSTVDFNDITFDNETANNTQKQIVKVAVSAADYDIIAVNNQCEAWVADIYQKVLGSRGYAPSAIAAGRAWSVSSDWNKIQIGAAVYGTSSNQYGHVGIYIGNGIVIHNLNGYVKTESLESWVKSYNGMCWGWENGKNLTGDPQYKCIGGLI